MSTTTKAKPSFVCMANKATVREFVMSLVGLGCILDGSLSAGFVVLKDDGVVVYRALEKGPGQPWIVSGFSSDRISWPES